MSEYLYSFGIGDRVQKRTGYPFPGIVVAVFETTRREVRYVIECTAPDVEGCLHIFSAWQLKETP